MRKLFAVSFLLLSFATTSVFAVNWQVLGAKTVTRVQESDTITVDRGKAAYKKLQLKVKGTALEVDRMVVYFKAGAAQKINLRNTIPANGTSRVIDLNGNNRAIKKVVFWYNSKGLDRRKATVTLLGR